MFKAILVLLLVGTAVAFREFQTRIPNGDRVPDPCHPNKLWQGVGHKQLGGGGDRNQFGKDFEVAGKTWTVALCQKDSDGDGMTNGQELGDPDCVWTPGPNNVPQRTDHLSHPGVCENPKHDSTACKEINSWEVCQEREFQCAPKDEEGVIKQVFRMTNSSVPAKETTYQCQFMQLPKDRDYHLIASEPYIDNANIMHHIVARGCPDEVLEEIKRDYSEPRECGMLSRLCGLNLDVWSLGLLGTCIDAPAALRFGKTQFSGFIMEFHWTNPELREDYWDSSGLTLYYTPNLRQYDAGMLFTGDLHLMLPPKQPEVAVESVCSSKCTKKIKHPLHLISGVFHMHLLGTEGYVDWYHDGQKETLIDEPYFSYDSPKAFTYKPEKVFNPGDELRTICKYNTMTRENMTYWGDDTFSEMCFSFFMYYPKLDENDFGLSCITAADADCATFDLESKCDFEKMVEDKERFINGLYDYCDPTGQECSKCCLLYLKSELKGHPCWAGDLREFTQFSITNSDGTNRTIQNMLLPCEHMHNLDIELKADELELQVAGGNSLQSHLWALVIGVACYILYAL